jgi:hypothetical protein
VVTGPRQRVKGEHRLSLGRPKKRSFRIVEIDLSAVSIGLGTILPVWTVAIQNAVQRYELGTAIFLRQFGGVVSAVFGKIVQGSGAGSPSTTHSSLELRGSIMPSGQSDFDGSVIFNLVFVAAGPRTQPRAYLYGVASPPLRYADRI